MERPTESFVKKFFFQYDDHPIIPHLNLPPNKQKTQTGIYHFTILSLSFQTSPDDTWTQSLITNLLSY